jgi:hypothetical protein
MKKFEKEKKEIISFYITKENIEQLCKITKEVNVKKSKLINALFDSLVENKIFDNEENLDKFFEADLKTLLNLQ